MPLLLAEPGPQRDHVRDLADDSRLEPLEMLVPFGEDERRPAGADRVDDVGADATVAFVVFDQSLIQRLELQTPVGLWDSKGHEGRRLHEHDVLERAGGGLCPWVDTMPNRSALHEDDRVVTVLARHGRGQTEDEPGLRLAGDALEALRRQMVALVDDEVPVVGDAIVDDALSDQALDDGDIEPAGGAIAPAANAADRFRRDAEERRQPLDPLVHELPAVDQDERVDAASGDQPRGDDRLAERRRGRQHAGVVPQHGVSGALLVDSQLALETHVQVRARLAFVAERHLHTRLVEHGPDIVQTTSRQADVVRVILAHATTRGLPNVDSRIACAA